MLLYNYDNYPMKCEYFTPTVRHHDSKIKSNIQSNKKAKLPVTIQNGDHGKRQYNQSIKPIKLPTNQLIAGLSSCSPSLSSVNCGNEEISAEKENQVIYRTKEKSLPARGSMGY